MTEASSQMQDQLRRERRACPVCAFEVVSPLVERCPRCFALLPKLEVHCEGCMHRFLCPARAQHADPPASAHEAGSSTIR